MLYSLGKFISFCIVRFFLGFKVRGQENIPKKGGFIIASNHCSFLDPPTIGAGCPRRLNYMAKDGLFKIPVIADILRNVSAFPVKREAADRTAIREALRRLERGEGLVLFPEGTRQPEGVLGQAEPGIGFLAAKSGAVVIPAYLKGTGSALPKGAKFLRKSKVTLVFGEQINVERRMPYQEVSNMIMDQIRRLSNAS